jgi:uncharacterized protein (DUF697 family)/GTP-binding protein EngB required for normal cell division
MSIIDNLDTSKIEKDLSVQMKNFMESLDKPRILLAGPTGCGKSTLCNLVFGKELCGVGCGTPVTRGIIEITDQNTPVVIFDSEGYETGANLGDGSDSNSQNYHEKITSFIDEQMRKQQPLDVVWYCVSAPSERITDADLKVIRAFQERKIPVALILTQIDVATEESCETLKQVIIHELGTIFEENIFESTIDYKVIPVKAGIKELYEWTIRKLPESRKESFIISCNHSFDQKFEQCLKWIKTASASAATASLSPVPFSDSAIITPIQIALIGKILTTWNLNQVDKLVSCIALDTILPSIGRTVAGNLVKMVPGLGSIVGAMINAGVSSSITFGIGYALNEACRQIHRHVLDGTNINLNEIFNDDFTKAVIKYAQSYKNQNSGDK